jgi:hypothetical protein
MIAMASKPVFERMLSTKCPSWSQKKALLTVIESLKGTFTQLDERLLQGSQLSDAEQTFYDSVSLVLLEAKEALVRKEMQAQVESGVLTKSELKTLMQQVTDRLDNLERNQRFREISQKGREVTSYEVETRTASRIALGDTAQGST